MDTRAEQFKQTRICLAKALHDRRGRVMSCGVGLEQKYALADAKACIDQRGRDIIIQHTTEEDVTRDIYNSIKKREPLNFTIKAFPVKFNPTADALEKAGIKENVDVLVTTAALDWMNNNLTIKDIDSTRSEVILDGETYTIKDKNQVNMFSDAFLNIVLGLFKK